MASGRGAVCGAREPLPDLAAGDLAMARGECCRRIGVPGDDRGQHGGVLGPAAAMERRILERDGDALVVSAVPLELERGELRLGGPRIERIRGWVDGTGFVEDAAPGDVVSIHWDWACERLDAARLEALRAATAHELRLANQTI